MKTEIKGFLLARALLYNVLADNQAFASQINSAARLINNTLGLGGKILIFGNGGSAAQSQHFAAELVCVFEKKRKALAAIALTTDSSILTAQSNDFGFETVFSRQIEALCDYKDLVVGLTTSDSDTNGGHSANIFNAFAAAKKMRASAIGLFSEKTKNLLPLVDVAIIAPDGTTAFVQEAHQSIIHLLCALVEEEL